MSGRIAIKGASTNYDLVSFSGKLELFSSDVVFALLALIFCCWWLMDTGCFRLYVLKYMREQCPGEEEKPVNDKILEEIFRLLPHPLLLLCWESP
jgi:hypothetical protein